MDPRVVYAHERVLIVDKPTGMTSEDCARAVGRKLVHRIDAPTSGLVMLADDARTVQRLQRALREGRVERTYRFVANGAVMEGARETTLVRDRGDGLRGTGVGGKRAACVLSSCVVGTVTHGLATLVTGRTHQLRIQLAEGGNPIVGERVYVRDARAAGLALVESERLMLHAERLRFEHPNTHELVEVVCAAPWA